jgi:DNA polymerase-3 subunit delta
MIYALHGEDAFSLSAEEKRLVGELVAEAWRSVNLTVFDGQTVAISEVVNAARTPSFFGDRLVVVRDCPWFVPAARNKKDEDTEGPASTDPGTSRALVDLFKEGLPGGCHLLLVAPRALNRTLSTTKALVEGAAAKPPRVTVHEFPGPDPYKPERTVSWLVAHARDSAGGIEQNAAQLLVERLGQDKFLLDSEVRKLSAYAGNRPIRPADIQLLSPPGESDVFELLETVAARRLPESVTHLRRLTLHDHPLKILATMTTFVRTWLQIKLLTERRQNQEAIGAAVKWHPFRVKKAQESLHRWTSGHVMRALEAIAEAEQALKGSGLPDALVMERLLAKLAAL